MSFPGLVGILNITEDSFSDGGRFVTPERAVAHARQLMADGAKIIELGPASSHPDASEVGVAKEIARLEPVVKALTEEQIPFGIDSFEVETQRWSIAHGAQMLNDIQGFPHGDFWSELSDCACDLVLMHSTQGRGPATRVHADAEGIMDRVLRFFDDRLSALERAGVSRERLIVDPGMGFFLAANPEPSLTVLRGLGRLRRETGCRVLVSVSRKSFLGVMCSDPATGAEREIGERLPATLAAEIYAARQGVDLIRTHDVKSLADALRVTLALEGDSFFVADYADDAAAADDTDGTDETDSNLID
jgi:dihydropteroate synthase type 2